MALIDVVKYNGNDNEFVFKYPSQDLRIGTQLVVGTSQTAFFVKGGSICDEFTSGTYTLKSDNLPVLNKLINIPFGGNSPFTAEVWYINQISKLDLKWGTLNPIQLEDPKYGVIVPVRAFGQYGFKISNPRIFLETLIGNMSIFTADKIADYFKGKILSSLTNLIANKLVSENVSILEISTLLEEMSDHVREKLNMSFSQFGIQLVSFEFISINVPEDDPSLIKLKEAKDLAAKYKIIGRDLYQMDRSFDVLDKAAGNEGGVAGSIVGAGIGLGAGLNIGSQMGNITSNMNTAPPPPTPVEQYHIIIEGSQLGPLNLNQVVQYAANGSLVSTAKVWKNGLPNWVNANEILEVSQACNQYWIQSPPPPPQL